MDEMMRKWHPATRAHFYRIMRMAKQAEEVGEAVGPSREQVEQAASEKRSRLESFAPGTLIQMDNYRDELGWRTTYGPYPKGKPVLDVQVGGARAWQADQFLRTVSDCIDAMDGLSEHIAWGGGVLPFPDDSGMPILRLMAFGATREYLLELFTEDHAKDPYIVVDSDYPHREVLHRIGATLKTEVGSRGFAASAPSNLTQLPDSSSPEARELASAKDVEIELRFAGKDLVSRSYGEYIGSRAQSPIEQRLAVSLVMQGLAPVLQLEVPDPVYSNRLTTADIGFLTNDGPFLVFADGAGYHGARQSQTRDRRVDARLEELGVRSIRLSGSDIYSNIERSVEAIKAQLFGRGARILPEFFWIPKIEEALLRTQDDGDRKFLQNSRARIERKESLSVTRESRLNRICSALGLERTYSWIG